MKYVGLGTLKGMKLPEAEMRSKQCSPWGDVMFMLLTRWVLQNYTNGEYGK